MDCPEGACTSPAGASGRPRVRAGGMWTRSKPPGSSGGTTGRCAQRGSTPLSTSWWRAAAASAADVPAPPPAILHVAPPARRRPKRGSSERFGHLRGVHNADVNIVDGTSEWSGLNAEVARESATWGV